MLVCMFLTVNKLHKKPPDQKCVNPFLSTFQPPSPVAHSLEHICMCWNLKSLKNGSQVCILQIFKSDFLKQPSSVVFSKCYSNRSMECICKGTISSSEWIHDLMAYLRSISEEWAVSNNGGCDLSLICTNSSCVRNHPLIHHSLFPTLCKWHSALQQMCRILLWCKQTHRASCKRTFWNIWGMHVGCRWSMNCWIVSIVRKFVFVKYCCVIPS